MCRKVKRNKEMEESNTHRVLENIFNDTYQSPSMESLLTTPSIISITEEPFGMKDDMREHLISAEWIPAGTTAENDKSIQVMKTV